MSNNDDNNLNNLNNEVLFAEPSDPDQVKIATQVANANLQAIAVEIKKIQG